MSRGASGHISAGGSGYFYHNDRTSETKNAQFSDEKNEYSCSANEAMQLYRQELSIRTQAYTTRTNQKLQKNIVTHRSMIINLEKYHTLEDLKKIKDYLETSLDTKVLQIAIHRDEGYVDDTGKIIKNYHAHIEFLGLDSLGISIAQNQIKKLKTESKEEFEKRAEKFKYTRANRLDSKFYTKLQTFLANTLDMERGKRGSKAKRLDTYDYKREAEVRSDLVREAKREPKLTISALKKEISNLRDEMKEKNKKLEDKNEQKVYTQADYVALNALKKELKKSNLQEIYQAYLALQKELSEKKEKMQELEKEIYSEKYKTPNKEPAKNTVVVKHLEKQLSKAQKEIEKQKTSISTQKELLQQNKQDMDDLEIENKELKEENKTLKATIQNIASVLECKFTEVLGKVKSLFLKKEEKIEVDQKDWNELMSDTEKRLSEKEN